MKIFFTLLLCNAYVSITHLRTRERINMLTVIPHSYSHPCRSYTDSLQRPQIMHHAHPHYLFHSHSPPPQQLAPSTVRPISTPSSPRDSASPLLLSSRYLKHPPTPSTQTAPLSFTVCIQHARPYMSVSSSARSATKTMPSAKPNKQTTTNMNMDREDYQRKSMDMTGKRRNW